MARDFYRKPPIIIALALVMTGMGLYSLIVAFDVRGELDYLGFDDYYSLDDEMKQKIQPKIFLFLTEFIFGIIMAPWGIQIVISQILNYKYRQSNFSRERKVAYFQTQFGFGILVIAIFISFSVQSMNDNRYDWMYIWGTLSMIGFIWLMVYREIHLRKIYDSDHDILR